MKLGREGLMTILGIVATTIIIGGLIILPLSKENKELYSKIERINKVNDDLFKENDNLIQKSNEKTEEINKKDKKIKELQEKIKDFEFKSINYNIEDITQPTNIKIEQLKILFKSNSTYDNLEGLEKAFVNAEKEYGINAMFLLGIVSQESGFVSSRRAIEENNLTGYAIYQNSSEKAFDSKYECILATARLLKNEYVDGRKIKDIRSINEVYCPDDNYKWSNSINKIVDTYMGELEVINDHYNNYLYELL